MNAKKQEIVETIDVIDTALARLKMEIGENYVVRDCYPLGVALREMMERDLHSDDNCTQYKLDVAALITAIDKCKKYW